MSVSVLFSHSIFLDDIQLGSGMKVLYIAENLRYGPSSAFLIDIFFALKGSKLVILIR